MLMSVVVSQLLALSSGCIEGSVRSCSPSLTGVPGCTKAVLLCEGGNLQECVCRAAPTVTTTVAIKPLVLAVAYALPGSGSTFSFTNGSTAGTRTRTIVSSGSGQSATVSFSRLALAASAEWETRQVTGQSGSISRRTTSTILLDSTVDFDPSRRNDDVYLWLNPMVVITDPFVGATTYAWDVSAAYPECGIYGMKVERMPAGMLLPRGTAGAIPPADGCQLAILNSLTDEDRKEILRYHPFFAARYPEGAPEVDPSTIDLVAISDANRRFEPWGEGGPAKSPVVFGSSGGGEPAQTFEKNVVETDCAGSSTGTISDLTAEVMKVRRIISGGRTYDVQTLNFSRTTSCEIQGVFVHLDSDTLGCLIRAYVYVDRMFGTIAAIPFSVSEACTEP